MLSKQQRVSSWVLSLDSLVLEADEAAVNFLPIKSHIFLNSHSSSNEKSLKVCTSNKKHHMRK